MLENSPVVHTYNDELRIVAYTCSEKQSLSFPENTGRVGSDEFSVLIVKSGRCTVYINQAPYAMEEKMIMTLREHSCISNISFSEDFSGYRLIVKNDFMRTAMGHHYYPVEKIKNPYVSIPIMTATGVDFLRLDTFVQQLISTMNLNDHAYQRSFIRNALSNLCLELWSIAVKYSPEDIRSYGKTGQKEKLAIRFMHLLRSQTMHNLNFSHYANQLNVSTVYLTRILKQITGKTGSEWLNSTLTDEAKCLLHHPDKTIQEIAETLHFSDQASFSRFFKKNTGKSPAEYRNHLCDSL